VDNFLADDNLEQIADSLEIQSGIFEKTWAVGQKIQNLFVIDRIIGRGHFGRVYQVKDNRGRICAVKTIDPKLVAHPDVPKRLDAVIGRLLDVKHANVVSTLSAGKADGFYYIKTPYLKAPTLAGGLKQSIPQAEKTGGIPPSQALRIIQAAAQAAQAIGWDIPHLNLLPGNMFIAPRGIVVADAGILFAVLPALSSREFSTMDHIDIRAPEVRSSLKSDASADVYSIAKLIYKLVTLQEPPLLFDDVPIVGEYPKKVRDVLLYATQENPTNRYANLHDFAVAFEQVLKGDSAPAPISRAQVDLDKILTPEIEKVIETKVSDIVERGHDAASDEAIAQTPAPDEGDIFEREIPEEQVFPPELQKTVIPDVALPADIIEDAEKMANLWKKAESSEQRAEAGYIESDVAKTPSAPAPVTNEAVVSEKVMGEKPKEIPEDEDPSAEITQQFFQELDAGTGQPPPPKPASEPETGTTESVSRPRAFDEGKPVEAAAKETVATAPVRRVEIDEELEAPTMETGFSTAKVTAISVFILAIILSGLFFLSASLKKQESQSSALDDYKHQKKKTINYADTFAQPDPATVKSTLSGDDIEMVVKNYSQSTSTCFNNGLKPSVAQKGTVLVSFTIQQQGSVSDAVVISSSVNDMVVEQCLRKAVLTMQFPPFKRSAMTVSYPFKFKK
jgi:TonB family protein